MSTSRGNAAIGILGTALVAGAIFWARQMETEVRDGFQGVRHDLQAISMSLAQRLDPVLEFKGSAGEKLKGLDARVVRLESQASAR